MANLGYYTGQSQNAMVGETRKKRIEGRSESRKKKREGGGKETGRKASRKGENKNKNCNFLEEENSIFLPI